MEAPTEENTGSQNPAKPPKLNLRTAVAELESILVRKVLDLANGNKSLAAKTLGIGRNTLTALIKRHRIKHAEARMGRPKSGSGNNLNKDLDTDKKYKIRPAIEELEKKLLEAALLQTRGNIVHASALLDMSRSNFYAKLKRCGLMRPSE